MNPVVVLYMRKKNLIIVILKGRSGSFIAYGDPSK